MEDWKIEAYVKQLTGSDSFDETFKSARAVKVLERYPKEIMGHLDKISSLSNKNEGHFLLILSILEYCDLSMIKSVFEKDILAEYSKMRSQENFVQDLCTFLNKIVLTNEADYQRDWLILAMQKPLHAVHVVLKEAIENPGKIDLVVDLILKLPNLSQYKIYDKLIVKLEEFDIAKLIIKLSEKDEVFANEMFKLLLHFALKSEESALKALEIMSKIKSNVTNIHDEAIEILSYIDKIISLKKSRTIQDGQLQNLINDFIQDVKLLEKEDMLLKLPWMKPHQWNNYSNVDDITDVLDKVIIIFDFIDDNQHRDVYLSKK